jgi:hypothetical protein
MATIKIHGALYDTVRKLANQVNDLSSALKTRCVTPPNFEIRSNFDIQNGDAFEIEVAGIQKTVATDQAFDTGTGTIVTTNAYWAAGLLSIDIDGTTGYVTWGAEASTEALAKAALSDVTAGGDVTCGYVAVQAASGQDLVGGTDALQGGSGGQVSQDTNYYNDQYVGAAGKAVLADNQFSFSGVGTP